MTKPKINFLLGDIVGTGGTRFLLELAGRLASFANFEILVSYYYKENLPFHLDTKDVKLVPLETYEPQPSRRMAALRASASLYRERVRRRQHEPFLTYANRLLQRNLGVPLDLSSVFVDNLPDCNMILSAWNTDALYAYLSGKGIPVYLAQTIPQFYREISRYRNRNATVELENIIYRIYEHFLCVSDYTRKIVVSANSRATPFIVNPAVDDTIFSGNGVRQSTSKIPTISLIISPFRFKGSDVALRVLNKVNEQRPIHVILIGSERFLNEVKGDNLKLKFSYDLVQSKSDKMLAELYTKSDVFLYTSEEESFGLPPLEAMSCGTPVVVTDCGGSREYARHEHNALIANYHDEDEIVRYVLKLCQDPESRRKVISGGYSTVEAFSWPRTLEQAKQAITSILERRLQQPRSN